MSSIILGAISASGGWTVAFVGYGIVFVALVLLVFIFNYLSKLINLQTRLEQKKKGKKIPVHPDDFSIEGDVNAAISRALSYNFV